MDESIVIESDDFILKSKDDESFSILLKHRLTNEIWYELPPIAPRTDRDLEMLRMAATHLLDMVWSLKEDTLDLADDELPPALRTEETYFDDETFSVTLDEADVNDDRDGEVADDLEGEAAAEIDTNVADKSKDGPPYHFFRKIDGQLVSIDDDYRSLGELSQRIAALLQGLIDQAADEQGDGDVDFEVLPLPP